MTFTETENTAVSRAPTITFTGHYNVLDAYKYSSTTWYIYSASLMVHPLNILVHNNRHPRLD